MNVRIEFNIIDRDIALQTPLLRIGRIPHSNYEHEQEMITLEDCYSKDIRCIHVIGLSV